MRRRASEGGRTVWRSGGRLAAAALLLTARPPDHLSAQEINNSGALFLVFPVGARAVGMGQAAAALEGRGEAAFWNPAGLATLEQRDRKSTRLNSSHGYISYAVFCLKKKAPNVP